MIYIEGEDQDGKKRKRKITLQSVVRKILVGRSIRSGIEGAMRGRLLMKADLPRELELEVAKQIECSLPAKRYQVRRGSSLKGMKKTLIISNTIEEAEEDYDRYTPVENCKSTRKKCPKKTSSFPINTHSGGFKSTNFKIFRVRPPEKS